MADLNKSTAAPSAEANTSGALRDPGARDPLRLTLQGLLAGFEVMIADGTALVTNDGPLPKAQIVSELSQALAVYTELDTHRRAVAQALIQIDRARDANRRRCQQLKDLLLGFYGRGNGKLGQFGMKEHASSRPLSSEAQVIRAQRVRDTRALRHTLGKRQKASIKGEQKISVVISQTAPAPALGPPGLRTLPPKTG